MEKRKYHCRAVFCWKRFRWFTGPTMRALGGVPAKLEHTTLHKLRVWSAAAYLGYIGELNSAYCVKCAMQCNSLFQQVRDWKHSRFNYPSAIHGGFPAVQSLKYVLTNRSWTCLQSRILNFVSSTVQNCLSQLNQSYRKVRKLHETNP